MASTTELVTDSVADIPKLQATAAVNGKEEVKSFWSLTFRQKIRRIRQVVTIEPVVAAYYMAAIICGPALSALELEKTCKANLNFSEPICASILNGSNDLYPDENDRIQIVIVNMYSWQQIVQSIVPLLLILFLGSYSDRHKIRKPFLLIPICGEFFAVVGCILCVIFMREWPLEVQAVAQTVVPSFFGGPSMLVMAAFSYIADISTIEMRTLRIGAMQIVLTVVQPISESFSGKLFELIGYIGILCCAAALYAFALLYGYFVVKEPKTGSPKSDGKSFWADLFNPVDALETLKLPFKREPGNNRLFIFLVLFLLFIYNFVALGEARIIFLYIQSVFQWTVVLYSYLTTGATIVNLIGTISGIWLFTKVFKFRDLTIISIAFIDKIVANFLYTIASVTEVIYVAIVCGLFKGLSNVGIRSLATKVVSENDLGKAQSLFGICEAIAQAVGVPVYSQIYGATIKTFPATFFLVGIGLYTLCLCLILWMYFKEKKLSEEKAAKEEFNGTYQMDSVTHM